MIALYQDCALSASRMRTSRGASTGTEMSFSVFMPPQPEKGEPLPDYFKNHPVYYAGPAKTPDGYASGAFGPTTAGRMDSFVDDFQAAGGSMVMLAKGNRSPAVTAAWAAWKALA